MGVRRIINSARLLPMQSEAATFARRVANVAVKADQYREPAILRPRQMKQRGMYDESVYRSIPARYHDGLQSIADSGNSFEVMLSDYLSLMSEAKKDTQHFMMYNFGRGVCPASYFYPLEVTEYFYDKRASKAHPVRFLFGRIYQPDYYRFETIRMGNAKRIVFDLDDTILFSGRGKVGPNQEGGRVIERSYKGQVCEYDGWYFKDMLRCIKKLKEMGYGLTLWTAGDSLHAKWFFDLFPEFAELFDLAITSDNYFDPAVLELLDVYRDTGSADLVASLLQKGFTRENLDNFSDHHRAFMKDILVLGHHLLVENDTRYYRYGDFENVFDVVDREFPTVVLHSSVQTDLVEQGALLSAVVESVVEEIEEFWE
jgi:hypothetical protein